MSRLGKNSFKIKELDTVIWNIESVIFTYNSLIYGTIIDDESFIKVRCE